MRAVAGCAAGLLLVAAAAAVGQESQTIVQPKPASKTYNKAGASNYGNSRGLLGDLMEPVTQYLAGRYDVSIGGNSPLPYAPDMKSYFYRDFAALYPYEMNSLTDYAESNSFDREDMLMHMHVNYTFSVSTYGWSEMDRFDAFERNQWGQYVNGVYAVNGSTYTDKTEAAYNSTVGDVAITDRLLLGYSEPFDEMNFVLSRRASDVAVQWQYWDGVAWRTLALRVDGTSGLTENGKILFTPPANWAQKSENGARRKWWVRAVVTGGGTKPVASRIFGDNWAVPGSAMTWRGWEGSHSGIVNRGLKSLEYNPDPPAEASARFRYQARMLGVWAKNLAFGNHANVQRGVRPFAKFLVDTSIAPMKDRYFNGLFMDDGITTPRSMVSPAAGWQPYSDVAGVDYLAEQIAAYKAAREYLREKMPNAPLGVNSTLWALVRHGDFAQCELAGSVLQGGIFYDRVNPNERAWNSLTYDQLLPENNPTGVKAMFAAWDTEGGDFIRNGEHMVWDRGDRGPMTALASYYMVANENTLFSYNTTGWTYGSTEDFEYISKEPDFILTAPVPIDTSKEVKHLYGDFSLFPDKYKSTAATQRVRIGNTGEYLSVWKVNNNQLATTSPIDFAYAAGTGIFVVRVGHLAVDPLPPIGRIVRFGYYFPALDVDIGLPDSNGHRGGKRDTAWKSAAEAGTAQPVQRRDFAGAIVLNSPGSHNTPGSRYAAYGNELALGGTYFRLHSNGRTGPAITSIRLRTGEGVVLLRSPRDY